MAEPRLATGLWVSAYLARLSAVHIPAYVVAHGDDTAGAVLVKCARLDGSAQLYAREWDLDSDQRQWRQTHDAPEPEIDAAIASQRRSDPDLWVLEIESRDGATLLDQDGLA